MQNKVIVALCLCGVLGVALSDAVVPRNIVVGTPIKAIYIDWHLNWNTPQTTVLQAVSAGYNVILFAFWLSSGTPADMAQAWVGLDDSTKISTVNSAHASGAVILVSFGGSTDSPYSKDAYSLGQQVGTWAKQQHLDGVDFDLENLNPGFTAGSMNAQNTVYWFGNITKGAYDAMGAGCVISHAPQGPYFGPVGDSTTWVGTTGGYTGVYKLVSNYITFFLVQFYNQGSSCYTDYNSMFVSSAANCPPFPKTSVSEIAAAGIPLSKIVVGKPVTSVDASNGWVSGTGLNTMFATAKTSLGWNGGLMGWLWNDPATCQSWVTDVYGAGGTNSGVTSANAVASTTATSTSAAHASTSSSAAPTTSSKASSTSTTKSATSTTAAAATTTAKSTTTVKAASTTSTTGLATTSTTFGIDNKISAASSDFYALKLSIFLPLLFITLLW